MFGYWLVFYDFDTLSFTINFVLYILLKKRMDYTPHENVRLATIRNLALRLEKDMTINLYGLDERANDNSKNSFNFWE